MSQPAAESAYLRDEHTPVADERTDHHLQVIGELPADLRGMFVRNSPNPQFPPPGRYHWFDGDGMVHGVQFADGQASYRNRWVRTRGFEVERSEGRAIWGGVMDPVDFKNPHGPVKDTANTDLVWFRERLFATWWLSGKLTELSYPDLDTLGPCDFDGSLKASVGPHVKVDRRTNELMFFGFNLIRPPYYHYGVIGADGRVTNLVQLDTPRANVPHDIAITPRFTLLLDFPLGYDAAELARGKRRIGFDRTLPGRIGVIPRHGAAADVRWFEVDNGYVYHTIEAHEDGPEVVLTACRTDDLTPEKPDQTGTIPRLEAIELVPTLYRWRLNLETGLVSEGALDDRPTEFPRVSDNHIGGSVRYSYNPRIARRDTLMFDGLIKYDLATGASVTHEFPSGWYSGEVVFAPRPGATDEDDGWLISVLSNVAEDASEAVILDARNVTAEPVARVRLPRRIPLGFHAEWAGGGL